ncbi:hypothetical protein [Ornithinimicrobium faecis]|uniref:hypothetical protein n=1 Tax=Ornithinimicrobium faecis TaxID=2934158 RepID=UPI0021186E17|nr:hypothetical protein [Ornithinimicrobium sp. HY1745]
MREPGGVRATRRQPPRWLWIPNLLVAVASVPFAVLGFWQFSRSDELHHLGFGTVFALMAIAFSINAAMARHHSRNNTGRWRPGNEWGSGKVEDPAPWI